MAKRVKISVSFVEYREVDDDFDTDGADGDKMKDVVERELRDQMKKGGGVVLETDIEEDWD